ncbi:hypothetical protein LCGC14_2796350 [marine sediment metagenome]|uniref:Uncharacterized protein n=1 Tax=marine sediment metagenome TaxID=412755 RepID=A0A0F9AXP7_9ZZZZ
MKIEEANYLTMEIKTVGDAKDVYEAAGLTRPYAFSLNLFDNARALKKLLDQITELGKQRDRYITRIKMFEAQLDKLKRGYNV